MYMGLIEGNPHTTTTTTTTTTITATTTINTFAAGYLNTHRR